MLQEKMEKRILWISFWAGLLFAVAELIFAIYSHSQSALTDAVYDCAELVFIALILFLTPLFHKPISEKYPYGFYQVETIFLLIKGVMMSSVTVSIAAQVVESALSGGNMVDGGEVSLFQLSLGVASVVVFIVMKALNRSISSPTVDAELLGWKLDIFYSFGLSAAFFVSMYLEKTPFSFIAPYFDQIVAVLVMVGMLPESIKMLWGTMKDLFLFSPDEETVCQIKDICNEPLKNCGFEPVFFDITRTGRHLWVSVYFKTDDDYLSVHELEKQTRIVNTALAEHFENCTCELIAALEESGIPQ